MKTDPLQELWTSQQATRKENTMHSIERILNEDRVCRDKEKRLNLWLAPLHFILLPLLFWCAATGKTPLVRTGYGLMGGGLAVCLSAAWLFDSWTRQALPGPLDTRAQLLKAAYLLSLRAGLARIEPLWTAPLFLGGALIGLWGYQERGHLLGYLVWAALALVWLWTAWAGAKKAKSAMEKKARMEALLYDLE
jgi:hypothetical protein